MKINKLFHWLYAILMLLPIFAIGVSCGYAIFNDNAFQSYEGLYETKEKVYVNDNNDFVIDNNYYLSLNNVSNSSGSNIIIAFQVNNLINVLNNTDYTTINYIRFVLYSNGTQILQLRETLDGADIYTFNLATNTTFTFDYKAISTGSSNYVYINDLFYTLTYIGNTIDNVFYYSLDKMKTNPLFSWANNNFLTNPFSYLFNLFGVPTNSGIMTLLSYWLDISIIWLVFDLIMYVPLLAHRWIDKGMID